MLDGLKVEKNQLVVIALHSFEDEGWRFSISLSKIDKILNNFVSKGYKFVKLGDLLNSDLSSFRGKNLAVSIDDGYKDNIKAVSLFRKYGIAPMLSVIVGNPDRKELENDLEMLSKEDLVYLRDQGWDIGSHGMTHSDFSKLSESESSFEIKDSFEALHRTMGFEPLFFSYPKGNVTHSQRDLVKQSGYKIAFGMNDQLVDQNVNTYMFPRVGLDSSHGVDESVWAVSPTTIKLRKFIKENVSKKLIERSIK